MPRPKQAYNLPQQGNHVPRTTAARAQTKNLLVRDSWVEERRFPKTNLSAPQRFDNGETSEKAWRENKIGTPRMQVCQTCKSCSLDKILAFNHTATKI